MEHALTEKGESTAAAHQDFQALDAKLVSSVKSDCL